MNNKLIVNTIERGGDKHKIPIRNQYGEHHVAEREAMNKQKGGIKEAIIGV